MLDGTVSLGDSKAGLHRGPPYETIETIETIHNACLGRTMSSCTYADTFANANFGGTTVRVPISNRLEEVMALFAFPDKAASPVGHLLEASGPLPT